MYISIEQVFEYKIKRRVITNKTSKSGPEINMQTVDMFSYIIMRYTAPTDKQIHSYPVCSYFVPVDASMAEG